MHFTIEADSARLKEERVGPASDSRRYSRPIQFTDNSSMGCKSGEVQGFEDTLWKLDDDWLITTLLAGLAMGFDDQHSGLMIYLDSSINLNYSTPYFAVQAFEQICRC